MNRRSFLKLLGIGAATAAVVPKILAEQPKSVSDVAVVEINNGVVENIRILPQGTYRYVYLAHTSLPVSAGDIVYYKDNGGYVMLAYKRKKLLAYKRNRPQVFWNELWGYGIGDLTPGNYGLIQLPRGMVR